MKMLTGIELKIGNVVYDEGCFGMYHGPYIVTHINNKGNCTLKYVGESTNENSNEQKIIKKWKYDFARYFEQVDPGWGGFWVLETPEVLLQITRNNILRILNDDDESTRFDFDKLTTSQLIRIKNIMDESLFNSDI